MPSKSIVTFNVFNPKTSSKSQQIDLDQLCIYRQIGAGHHGDVYSAYLKGNKHMFALKVFKPWPRNSDPQSRTPFERELDAYKLILQDETNQNNCPVVKVYGWFTLPENFERPGLGRDPHILTGNHQAQVLVKKLMHDNKPFAPKKVTPNQMMVYIDVLKTLEIHVPDINSSNFLGGKIADLSSADITSTGDARLIDQSAKVMRMVLGYYGWQNVCQMEVEAEWEVFRAKALCGDVRHQTLVLRDDEEMY